MSSSLLVTAIETAGKNAGLNIKVTTYHSIGSAYLDFSRNPFDLILIAPQIRLFRKSIEKQASPYGIPVLLIEPRAYGMVDGEHILQQVLMAIGEHEEGEA
jgi:PTS system cellobiose-specific IIB component